MKKFLNIVTFENFVKYVMVQFMAFHIFYSALNGGEGSIMDIHSWIPFMVFVGMLIVVGLSEFIRHRDSKNEG